VSGVEENNLLGLNLFPNPANNEITLNSDVMGAGTLTVVDMTGRIVLQHKTVVSSTQKINIQDLPSGIYSLSVTIENKQSVTSFVKL
jgi:hypothetical protein